MTIFSETSPKSNISKLLYVKKYNFWPKNRPLINSMDIITKQKEDSQICICFIANNIYWTNSLVIKDQRVKNFLVNVNNVGVMKMFFFMSFTSHSIHSLVSNFRMRISFLVLRIYRKIKTISMNHSWLLNVSWLVREKLDFDQKTVPTWYRINVVKLHFIT